MILEWLETTLTPAPPFVRKLRLVHEAVAIEARYKRRSKSWSPHLEKTKQIIAEICSGIAAPKAHVSILGSGGLHDVDIEDLSRTFARIDLIDIVHLRRTNARVAAFDNVARITRDVTGLGQSFVDTLQDRTKAPFPLKSNPQLVDGTPDLVISLNLLSQLALPMTQLAVSAQMGCNEDRLAAFEEEVMRAHVRALHGSAPTALLITDLERRYKKANIIEVENVLPEGLDLGEKIDEWTWAVAPKGESKFYDTIDHKVGAFVVR
jgi:hypothetical protein